MNSQKDRIWTFVHLSYKLRKDDDGKGWKPQQINKATGEVYLKLCIKLSEILQLKTVLAGLKDCSVPYTKHPMIFKKPWLQWSHKNT